jgi:hypothetical protein
MLYDLTLAFVISLLTNVASQPPAGDRLYAPKEAEFELRFPTKPTIIEKPHLSGTIAVASVQRKSVEEFGYVCQWFIREKAFDSTEAEIIYLKGQQSGSVAASKGKLLQERRVTLKGIKGREFAVEVSDNNVFRCRVFVTGKRVIHVQVWGTDLKALDSKEVSAFFDSLKITK